MLSRGLLSSFTVTGIGARKGNRHGGGNRHWSNRHWSTIEYDRVNGVQALEKKHKLEPYEKIKEKSILEMVRTFSWSVVCMVASVESVMPERAPGSVVPGLCFSSINHLQKSRTVCSQPHTLKTMCDMCSYSAVTYAMQVVCFSSAGNCRGICILRRSPCYLSNVSTPSSSTHALTFSIADPSVSPRAKPARYYSLTQSAAASFVWRGQDNCQPSVIVRITRS